MTTQHQHNQVPSNLETYQFIYKNSVGQAKWENILASSEPEAYLAFERKHQSDYVRILEVFKGDVSN